MADLNTLISASGVALKIAYAINTTGQIVGYAGVKTSNKTSEIHAFLLTPR